LETLEAQIMNKLESGAAIDVEYWEGLLSKLTIYKAKAKLDEIYVKFGKNVRLFYLEILMDIGRL
jgi:hypothetical protein